MGCSTINAIGMSKSTTSLGRAFKVKVLSILQKYEKSIKAYRSIGKKSSFEKTKLFFFKSNKIEPKNKIKKKLFNPNDKGIDVMSSVKKMKEIFSLFSDCMSVKTFFKKL
jgi:hypothetical protein